MMKAEDAGMAAAFEMIVERLANIENRLADMQCEQRRRDAVSDKGKCVPAWGYNKRDWVVVNHVGDASAGEYFQTLAVMFGEPRSRGCILCFDEDHNLIARGVHPEVERVLGSDTWGDIVRRCAALDFHKDVFACAEAGLGNESPKRDAEEAIYETILKQRYPGEVNAVGWTGIIIKPRPGNGKTWLERTMDILADAIDLMEVELRANARISVYSAWFDKEHEPLYRAILDEREDGIVEEVEKLPRWRRQYFLDRAKDEHELISTCDFLFPEIS